MSADNYIFVGKLGDGRFGAWDCFASDDNPLHRNNPWGYFATAAEAIKAAHKAAHEGYYEYGVVIEPAVLSTWTGE